MACRRCGSSWCTKAGKDKASCPECCKQQLCKARKQGLLPSSAEKTCKRCGQAFIAMHANAVARQLYCDGCKDLVCVERREEYKSKDPRRELSKRRRMVSFLRSVVGLASNLMRTHLVTIASVQAFHSCQPRCCAVCAKAFRPEYRHPDSRFCSFVCAGKWSCSRECHSCGSLVKVMAIGRNAKKRVRKVLCRVCSLRKYRTTEKAKDSRRLRDNYRKRCRLNGVPFDPAVKPKLVFDRDRRICHICKRKTLEVFTLIGGKPHTMSPTVDHHPYPLSAGVMGHTWDNVRCACWGCNTAKGAKWSGQLPLPLGLAAGLQT